ncbi:MAG: YraN family protein [Firmicutes bacterium]|nr:YraN family protein [Bacillota bacterium]
MRKKEFGKRGEKLACEILAQEGYEILAEKYRYARGEIDLVGLEGEILAFIEVKTRRLGSPGTPAEAVDRRKRSRMVGAARHFLYTHGITDRQCRFDVLSIIADEAGGLVRYELLRDAFWVERGGSF